MVRGASWLSWMLKAQPHWLCLGCFFSALALVTVRSQYQVSLMHCERMMHLVEQMMHQRANLLLEKHSFMSQSVLQSFAEQKMILPSQIIVVQTKHSSLQ